MDRLFENSTLREQIFMIMAVLMIPVMLFAALRDLREYWRLPDQPSLLTTAAALKLAASGKDPFIQLTDAQWDCDHLVIEDGKVDYTKVELLAPVSDSLIEVTLRGKYRCANLTDQVIVGVLQATARVKHRAPGVAPTADNPEYRKVYALCGYCSRQFSLSQALQEIAMSFVFFILLVGLAYQAYIQPSALTYSASRTQSVASRTQPTFYLDDPPAIHHPVWLNGKLRLDGANSSIQAGAALAIASVDGTTERFSLRFNDSRTFLFAGGQESSLLGKRLLNDVVPVGKAVTLTVINPDGQSSAPVTFQR